jgi:hypothetical protein
MPMLMFIAINASLEDVVEELAAFVDFSLYVKTVSFSCARM